MGQIQRLAQNIFLLNLYTIIYNM